MGVLLSCSTPGKPDIPPKPGLQGADEESTSHPRWNQPYLAGQPALPPPPHATHVPTASRLPHATDVPTHASHVPTHATDVPTAMACEPDPPILVDAREHVACQLRYVPRNPAYGTDQRGRYTSDRTLARTRRKHGHVIFRVDPRISSGAGWRATFAPRYARNVQRNLSFIYP